MTASNAKRRIEYASDFRLRGEIEADLARSDGISRRLTETAKRVRSAEHKRDLDLISANDDTRVRDAWARQDRREAAQERHRKAEKILRRLRLEDGGKEGALPTKVKLRVSGARSSTQTVRCRPGSFEWKFGRNKQDALFHAGSQFAQLWERAGIAVASSADFLRGTKSGYATGISEGRLAAIQKIRTALGDLGHASTDRLIAYCVAGRTSVEIAQACGVEDRVMSAILNLDLKACARALRFS